MYRNMCSAKIHLASVTQRDINYEGSITIDPDFYDQVGLKPYELVHVVNRNNGYRAETYVIPGTRGSKVIGINGPLARHAELGDRIVIIGYKWIEEKLLPTDYQPKVLNLDENNNPVTRSITSHA